MANDLNLYKSIENRPPDQLLSHQHGQTIDGVLSDNQGSADKRKEQLSQQDILNARNAAKNK